MTDTVRARDLGAKTCVARLALGAREFGLFQSRQVLMDFSNNDRTLAHSRSHALNGTRPHVTNGEDAGHRGVMRRCSTSVRASPNETRGIGIQTLSQPLGVTSVPRLRQLPK